MIKFPRYRKHFWTLIYAEKCENLENLILTCELEYVGHRMQSIAAIRTNQFGSRNPQLGWLNDPNLIKDESYPHTANFNTRHPIKWISRKFRVDFKCKFILLKDLENKYFCARFVQNRRFFPRKIFFCKRDKKQINPFSNKKIFLKPEMVFLQKKGLIY